MLHKDYDHNGSVANIYMVVSLKGSGAKSNWLAVNRPSLSNFDFEKSFPELFFKKEFVCKKTKREVAGLPRL
jgi:hypothetical protein